MPDAFFYHQHECFIVFLIGIGLLAIAAKWGS